MIRVTYFSPTDGGCDYYRGIMPLKKAEEKGAIKANIMRPHNFVMDQRYHKEKFDSYMTADVVILPRSMEYALFDEVRDCARVYNKDVKILVEYDDNLFNVSPLSPHYADHGITDVNIVMPDGEVKTIWKDGVNYNSKKNKEKMAAIRKLMREADGITTTTDILADVFKQYNERVLVLPNCVDMKRWRRVEVKRDNPKEIRLFWAGGHSHYEDWFQIKDAVRVIMNKYKNAKLIIMGAMWESTLKGIDRKQIEFHSWEDTSAYPYKVNILNPDIGLIPLRDTDFNRCKSAIKWIELGALQVPCVTSYLPPYSLMADLEKNNGIFIEENVSKNWVTGISYLIDNSMERRKMADNAYKTVFNHFDINTQYSRWVDVFKEAIEWQPQATQPLHK